MFISCFSYSSPKVSSEQFTNLDDACLSDEEDPCNQDSMGLKVCCVNRDPPIFAGKTSLNIPWEKLSQLPHVGKEAVRVGPGHVQSAHRQQASGSWFRCATKSYHREIYHKGLSVMVPRKI